MGSVSLKHVTFRLNHILNEHCVLPAAHQFKSLIRDCDIDFRMLESQLRRHVVPLLYHVG